MYQQPYPGYQQVRPPNHPHTSAQPLHLQTSQTAQSPYSQYNYTASPSMATPRPIQGPPSPSEQSERASAGEEELYTLAGPPPTSHIWDGFVWALEVVQHPQRARMCGFGDKDRRPISPPPCIRLIILDPKTKQEVKYDDIELAHLVLAVDIWDIGAGRELNLVKQSSASPCISSAATAAFPVANTPSNPAVHERPPSFPIAQIPAFQNSSHSSPTASQPQTSVNAYYPQGATSFPSHRPNFSNGEVASPATYQNGSQAHAQNQYQYGEQPYPPQAAVAYGQQSQQQPGSHQPGPPSVIYDGHPAHYQPTAQMFTRNLIGSLSASAFKLQDENGKLGIWFVLQDLSVRTEGWFRLKLNFFNLSHSVESQMKSMAANGGAEPNPPVQTETTAPCLASAFSNPFKVFSAKKFPGVVESTPLSRAFATQGIKIPIRKDTQSGSGPKRGRDGSDDDDNNSDLDG